MDTIQVLDKRFRLYMPESQIQSVVGRMASVLSRDYRELNPVICPVLNGSYVFAADLLRQMDIDAEVSFVRYASYEGMASSGEVKEVMGFPEKCRNRHVLIVEDIIDSGVSMEYVLQKAKALQPASVALCTLLFKPDCFRKQYKIDYIGKEIPNDFIVGYGLDYNGMGRTYRNIYVLDE